MKQLKLMKTLLVAAGLLLGTSAWAENVSFSAIQDMTVSDGTVTASYSSSRKRCLAIADLTSLTGISTAAKVQIEFDCNIGTSAGRFAIGIGDASTRGTTANGSTQSNYNTEDIITYFGLFGRDGNLRVGGNNGTTYTTTSGNKNVHVTFTLNRLNDTYTLTLVDADDETSYYSSGSLSTTVDNATIIEIYSWADGSMSLSDASVTVTQPYTYTVNAVIKNTSTVLKTIATGTVITGESVTVPYSQYMNVNGTLYNAPCLSDKDSRGNYQGFGYTFEASGETIKTIEYSATATTNVVCFSEAENIIGLTACSDGQGSSRASGRKGAYTSNDVVIGYLPAGTYQLTAQVVGNATATFQFYAGETKVHEKATVGYRDASTSETFERTELTPITLKAAGSSGSSAKLLDFVRITGTPATGEYVGDFIFSTEANGAYSDDYIMKPGDTKVFTFQNHGTTFGNNWRIGVKQGETWKANVCADSYDYTNSTVTNVTSYQMSKDKGSSKVGIDWNDFATDMADANVVATLTYGTDGTLAIRTTSTGAANGYIYYVDHDVTGLTGEITINLSVNHSWLEILSVEQTAVGMTIGDATWASFSNANEVAIPSGVTAYYASASDGSSVTLKPIDGGYIPANTGVVLNGTAGTYSADVTSKSAAIAGTNLLHPWLTAGTPSEGTYYTLAAGPTFKKSIGGTLAAGKAYLVLPTSARELSVVFDNETNGIQQVESAAQSKGAYYNLAGQRIAQPTKGLYIVNGKKVVIK